MKNTKRAQRRADSENLVKRYRKYFVASGDKKFARKCRDHPKACSCNMCRNPRHSALSKGAEKLTRQERVQEIRERDVA